jgi:glucosamine-phosphate N-acetyltransferase
MYGSQQRMPSVTPKRKPLDPDEPIFKGSALPAHVLSDLPPGYIMRPLTRADYSNGFLEVLRVTGKVGYVSQRRWDERCEYLRKRGEEGEEYVLVIVDVERDRIVGVGRLVSEKGL